MPQPHWLAEAWQHLAVAERPGPLHNATVIDFYRDAGHPGILSDEVPWCAAFVSASLERSNEVSTKSLLARSYLKWGMSLDAPRWGAITVLTRGTDPRSGHVGFYLGETDNNVILLGGNQADRVSVAAFPKSRVLSHRWPDRSVPGDAADIFEVAFRHVLKMEGGYTNDPYDPGGPTNKGIILSVLAAHLGRVPTDANRAELIAKLKNLPDATAREIYRQRYWRPCSAADLPAPIAFMHFDAAVNHGVNGAAKLLQRALNVTVDGEIGPITLGAAKRQDASTVVRAYAAARRAKYRNLPHFWRFGKGWLNRVDQTLAQAHRLHATVSRYPDENQQKGSNDMATQTDMITPKPWGRSLTIWGAVITALSTVVPALSPMIGLDLTPDIVRQAGEQLVTVVQAIGGLTGTLMTIFGRVRASAPLSVRFANSK